MTDLPLLLQAWRDPERACGFGLADWDKLLRQAERVKLLPALAGLFEERGLLGRLPPQVCAHFVRWKAVGLRHRQGTGYEVMLIQAALRELGLPLVLLKGAAYAVAGLPPAPGRLFNDIDILVPKALLGKTEAALMLHGWTTTHQDAYDQRYYRTWMHELPPMENVKRGTRIDVHHAILPETAPVRPDPRLLLASAVPVGGMDGIQVLAPADMVLHSAVHLFYGEFEYGLRDLVDLHRLLSHFGRDPAFWPHLVARARTLELGRPLHYTLRHASRLLGTPVPPAILAAAAADAPSPLMAPIMDALFVRAIEPDHPSCRRAGSGLARFCLYVRSNWLRMPPLLLAQHLLHKAIFPPKQSNDA